MPRITEVADNVIAVVETASTNTLARQMLRDGTMAPPADGGAGVAVVATDVQSAGRGRLERTWVSAPGESMTCSYIATLPAGVIADGSVNGWLTVIAGFAALDALRGALAECGVASEDCGLRLKWPNDLFCQGRKLGGILTEMVPLPGRDDSAADNETCSRPPTDLRGNPAVCASPLRQRYRGVMTALPRAACIMPTIRGAWQIG